VAAPPSDWSGVEQWARALTRTAGGETQQIGINLSYYSAGNELVFQQKLQPLPMVDPKTNTVNWGRPEVLEAFTWYTAMAKQYGDPNFRQRDFWGGKVGMMIGHPVSRGGIAQRAPDLKYTIHQFPPPAGKPPLTIGSHWAWVVNKQPKQQKEAWRWIAFGTSDDAQLTWYRTAGDLPSRKKFLADPALRKTPNDVVVMDSMRVARPWSWIGWADWVRVYNESVERVIKGEQGPKQSLAQAAEEINRVIQENLPPK
jgi:ABC-type glycerol-3-phosphate transport system substrate-binding protein